MSPQAFPEAPTKQDLRDLRADLLRRPLDHNRRIVVGLVDNVLAERKRAERAEAALRDATALLRHYDRTSSLDPGLRRSYAAQRSAFLRARTEAHNAEARVVLGTETP